MGIASSYFMTSYKNDEKDCEKDYEKDVCEKDVCEDVNDGCNDVNDIYINNLKRNDNMQMKYRNRLYAKYYKLYIYINPSVSQNVKDAYITNADEHNYIVDSYLNVLNKIYKSDSEKCTQSISSNYDFDSELEYDMEDYCFDAGFDLICPEDIECDGLSLCKLDHKINCCMKLCNGKSNSSNEKFVGYYLYSRSSTSVKTPLRLANSVGIIDSGYRGNIKAMFDYNKYDMEHNVRYAQLCPPNIEYPMKVFIVNNYDDLGKSTQRGSGGFGSTG